MSAMPGFWIVVGVLLVLAVAHVAWKSAGRRKGSEDPVWRDRPPPTGQSMQAGGGI
jgi:hypothetical protein